MTITIPIPSFACPENMRIHLEKVFLGEYDIPVTPRAPRILDLGANCGAFSVWASHRFPGSIINAYEPHPLNFNYLKRNTENYPNVTLHNYAVGTPGLRILGDGRFNEGEASFYHVANNPHPTGRHVEVLDPLTLPEADIIKLDIEGAEGEVLIPLITEGRRFMAVMLEYHNHELRREIDSLLIDYYLVSAHVEDPIGRGTVAYLHKDVVV
jgi:FkbM family methyltransferase